MSGYRQLLYHIVFRTQDSQQEHHRKKTFEEEYRSLLQEFGIRIDERYFP
jgi:hypothetical protein